MSSPTNVSRRARSTLTLLSILAVAVHAAPSTDSTQPSLQKRLAQTYSGCYSSSEGLTEVATYTYQSTGYCGEQCTGNGNQAVLGLTNGNDCWCGNALPPSSSKVDDSKCNVGCTGYGDVDCGGNGYWSVYLTGTEANVPEAGTSSSSSSHSSSVASPTSSVGSAITSSPAQVVTSVVYPYSTVVVTQSASSTSTSASNSKDKGGSNTAAVAAGVVVGIVAAAALVGGVFFFLRRRRQRQAEEDYKRSTQVADFMRSTQERKPPGTSYSQASDQRLEPDFGARRNSVGSVADSQDYSRRILRVANPDGH